MEGLNNFENAVLTKLLAGDHPLLIALRSQAERAQLSSRDYTGAGFFCVFTVPSDVTPLARHLDFEFGDVNAQIAGLKHGAGFVVFVRDGRLDMLEGYSYDEPWPEVIGDFELSYKSEPRNLDLPCS
ncbi:hypothetical protein [Parvibaculum sp.]|uniref:hypothetical protein n=1 Tax=Parvibaculum sp. TaxID=2024848 RepID=UPI00272F59DF|nr:hypothetical protein [Parvibaculum sp.]MDP1626565.1 hypothetical protein [Parvibaculum sp.]MDP2150487.1 hypothetical protein [Parvibaculum sp.]MDP3327027.1 hypothetical protein [Parvibaculum sp.]